MLLFIWQLWLLVKSVKTLNSSFSPRTTSVNFIYLTHFKPVTYTLCVCVCVVQVKLSSKQTPHFLSPSRPLSHARCLELANHCLGFNGWTSDIITVKSTPRLLCLSWVSVTAGDFLSICPSQLKELTNEEEEEEKGEDEEGGGGRRTSLRYGCLLQISFPHHGQTTRGAAVVEDSFTCTGEDHKAVVSWFCEC